MIGVRLAPAARWSTTWWIGFKPPANVFYLLVGALDTFQILIL